MEYQQLLLRLAEQTETPVESVRKILETFPEILMEGAVGETTRTPLGVFTLKERKPGKTVQTPTGQWGAAQPIVRCKLKSGKKLQRDPLPPPDLVIPVPET